MKKETADTILRRKRVQAKRWRKSRKRYRRRENQGPRIEWFSVIAPQIFSIRERAQRRLLIVFLEKLRSHAVLRSRRVRIDFSRTVKMFAEGTLLFKAELARILRIIKSPGRFRCRPPQDDKVAEVLQQVGIYELLHYRSYVEPQDADVVFWRHASGFEARGETYERVLGELDRQLPEELQTNLYVGMVEAMTNAIHHAYDDVRFDRLNHRDHNKEWWMFSQVRDGRLSVAICDLGIGIPRSLPLKKKDLWARLRETFGSAPKDCKAIRSAVEESRSRTGHSYRGKGLKQLISAVDGADGGTLMIYSNAGLYICRRHGSNIEEKDVEHKQSILGTLICWSLPLKTAER